MANTVQDRFAQGVACLNAGDVAGAEAHFRAGAASTPPDPQAVLALGIVLFNRNAFAEAEPILLKAAKLKPTLESFSALAGLMAATNRLGDAMQYYEVILQDFPAHAPTLKKVAAIYKQVGDRRAMRSFYKRAWDADPADLSSGIEYGIASFHDDHAETGIVMDRLVATAPNDRARLQVINNLLLYKEFSERKKRGLMFGHVTSLDELFFTYCAADFALFRDLAFKAAEKTPDDTYALMMKFTALFCSRDSEGAQKYLERFRPAFETKPNQVWSAVTFDPAFYRKLESMPESEIAGHLPPLLNVLAATFREEPVVYLSCDYFYFTSFAMPMILSLADKGPGSQLHMHIMDATDEQLEQAVAFCRGLSALTIAISAERPDAAKGTVQDARNYYHAIRLIRYYHALTQYKRTLWLMDVDALIQRDPRELYRMLEGNDAAMRVRAGRFEPWNQFNASVVAAAPTAAGIRYFRLIAAYISHFHRGTGLRWGIDQCAMYGAFDYLSNEGAAPALALLNDRAVDYDYLDDGIVWCNSGRNKFAHLNRKADGSATVADPDREKYVQLFDKYWRALQKS